MTGGTRYVFLSSGAIYGALRAPAEEGTELRLPVNRLESRVALRDRQTGR